MKVQKDKKQFIKCCDLLTKNQLNTYKNHD